MNRLAPWTNQGGLKLTDGQRGDHFQSVMTVGFLDVGQNRLKCVAGPTGPQVLFRNASPPKVVCINHQRIRMRTHEAAGLIRQGELQLPVKVRYLDDPERSIFTMDVEPVATGGDADAAIGFAFDRPVEQLRHPLVPDLIAVVEPNPLLIQEEALRKLC